MFMLVPMMMFFVFVSMRMFRAVRVSVFVLVRFVVLAVLIVSVGQMHIELYAFNLGFLLAGGVQMVAIEFQLSEFALEFVKINAQIEQRSDKHIAADAAENIEIKCFHFRVDSLDKALIWLAA